MSEYDFIVKQKVFSLSFDSKFNIFDANDKLIGLCNKKAFKLKEDIRVFSDEGMTKELIAIKAKSVVDFTCEYDVVDSTTNTLIGTWRREGLKSMARDTWIVKNELGQVIGKLEEDSMALALVRRFLTNLIPQNYELKDNSGKLLVTYNQTFNPFCYGLKVKQVVANSMNPKLAMAGAMLLAAIEGRQE